MNFQQSHIVAMCTVPQFPLNLSWNSIKLFTELTNAALQPQILMSFVASCVLVSQKFRNKLLC